MDRRQKERCSPRSGKALCPGPPLSSQRDIKYTVGSGDFQEDRTLQGVDISGHYGGVTFQGEYNVWKEDFTESSASKEPTGWYIQAGYFIPHINIEPAIRYEIYDEDTNKDNKKEKVTTLGFNWYIRKHNLKIGINWLHGGYGDKSEKRLSRDKARDVYQIQGQVYF